MTKAQDERSEGVVLNSSLTVGVYSASHTINQRWRHLLFREKKKKQQQLRLQLRGLMLRLQTILTRNGCGWMHVIARQENLVCYHRVLRL